MKRNLGSAHKRSSEDDEPRIASAATGKISRPDFPFGKEKENQYVVLNLILWTKRSILTGTHFSFNLFLQRPTKG
jgi:hypothetical protein